MPGSPRSNDPRHPRMLKAREREQQALTLRASGASITAIAAELEITPGAVCKCITRALEASQPDPAKIEERRALIQERFDRRRLEVERILSRPHPVLHQGRPVVVVRQARDGTQEQVLLDDDGIRMQALDRLARVDEDERTLWGLDAARKYEHAGEGGGPVKLEVRVASLLERTRAVVAATRDLPEPERLEG